MPLARSQAPPGSPKRSKVVDLRTAGLLSPLNVLVVTPLGQGGQGGIDRLMDELRAHLAAHPSPGLVVRFGVTRGQGSLLLSPFLMIRTLSTIIGDKWRGRLDLLHVNLSSHGSTWRKLVIVLAAGLLGIPYLVHLHGSGFRPFWDGAPARASARIAAMFRAAAAVLVLGSVWRDFVLERVPEAKNRIVILPNAVPTAQDARPDLVEKPTILFLGQVGARKGVPELVRALTKLPRDREWRAIIAGNGEVEQTRGEIVRLGLAERVEVPGWVGPAEVRALLRAATILVLPSHEENLPMSVIEGMAHGLAIVTTPVGAVEDIIRSGETGLLVPPGDSDALAGALGRLLADRDLCNQLGRAARDFHARHLETGGYVDRLVRIWREAAAGIVRA